MEVRRGGWPETEKTDKEREECSQQTAKDNDVCASVHSFIYCQMLRFPNSSDNMPKSKWLSPTLASIRCTYVHTYSTFQHSRRSPRHSPTNSTTYLAKE